MAQRITETVGAVDTTRPDQRGAPILHPLYFKHWDTVLDQVGYRYIGTTSGRDAQGSVYAPPWRPETYLHIPPYGTPTLHENACPHQGNFLVEPAEDGIRRLRPRELACRYHGLRLSLDGSVIDSSMLHVASEHVPCVPERKLWARRGLVFELGIQVDEAIRELEAAFTLLERYVDLSVFAQPDATLGYLQSPETASWLMTLINYLDIPHVRKIHASRESLSGLVRDGTYTHDRMGDLAVIQCMGLNPQWWETPWGRAYHASGLPSPRYGAVWLTTRMGWMAEVYPATFASSQCRRNRSDWKQCTLDHQFLYQPGFSTGGISHQRTVFQKTAEEDSLYCTRATDHVERRILQGKGWQPWGFFSPEGENFGNWHYASVRELLSRFFPQEFPQI